MYVPIGGDLSLRSDTIIALFDLDNATWSHKTREFLRRAEENGEVVPVTDELPKTMILTRELGLDRVWLTQFGAATIQKRMEKGETHG